MDGAMTMDVETLSCVMSMVMLIMSLWLTLDWEINC
jgi:hypothetical protein